MTDGPKHTLDRPPSARYATGQPGDVPQPGLWGQPETARRPSWRPELAAAVAAVAMAALLVALGGVLGATTGELFVSGVGGAAVGLLTAGSNRPARTRHWLGVGLALAAVLVGAGGDWLIARGEGGSLGPLDYLWATSGLLVPAEAALAALAAAWAVRAGPVRG